MIITLTPTQQLIKIINIKFNERIIKKKKIIIITNSRTIYRRRAEFIYGTINFIKYRNKNNNER